MLLCGVLGILEQNEQHADSYTQRCIKESWITLSDWLLSASEWYLTISNKDILWNKTNFVGVYCSLCC